MSLQILELMDGARRLVIDVAEVHKGQQVLILEDTTGTADPLVVEAIAITAKEAGADVTTANCRLWEPRIEDPPKIVANAMYGADVVFDISCHEAPLHCRAGRIAMLEYGASLIGVVANTAELMASEWARFPAKLYWTIYQKQWEKMRSGKTIRVVSPNGTDISAGLHPAHILTHIKVDISMPAGYLPPGSPMFNMFPLGCMGVHPRDPANGVIVYDALLGIKGLLKEPVRVTVQDHWVTNVEGGEAATWFKNLIAERKREGAESDYWSEIMWGLNPKASIDRGLAYIHLREAELTRRAGTLHFGIGKTARGFHWDGVLVKPFSVFIDGEPIIEKGKILAFDDPEVRQVAKEFGDPDQLLATVP